MTSKMEAGIKRSRCSGLTACLAVALICAVIALIAILATHRRCARQCDAKTPDNASPRNSAASAQSGDAGWSTHYRMFRVAPILRIVIQF